MTYYNIHQLTGIGYEVLLDGVDGTLIARFYNGTIVCNGNKLATEGEQYIETKVAA